MVPDGLSHQVPVILDVLAAAGLATADRRPQADDVIGTLAPRNDPVEVVNGHRSSNRSCATSRPPCG